MKKVLFLILALFFIISITCTAMAVEVAPHIVYTQYDGYKLTGLAEVNGEEGYWARVTFFMPYNDFILLFIPISAEGEFYAYIYSECEHLAIQIVDNPTAILPGEYTCYDTTIGLLW